MRAVSLILTAAAITPMVAQAAPKDVKKPNVIYILTDQWRGSAFGYAGDPNVKTPELDKFSNESVNFTNAVSTSPVSTPYRAALLTGRYPSTTGMFLNDLYLPSEELCMAEIFKAEGYTTAYWGKWHLDGHGRTLNVDPDRRQGFDHWKGLECSHNYNKMPYYENDDPKMKYWDQYSPYAIVEDANEYLKDHANDEKPFLAFVSLATPHFPHNSAPEEIMELYPQDKLILQPNVPQKMEEIARKEMQGYYAHCTATDKAIGNLLDNIKELGLMENTIVVFTSDHGEMLGSHGEKPYRKQVAWDESINVPFLISYPEIGDNKGKVVNAPINTPDILPSLLGLSGVAVPSTIEGEDISKLIKNPNENADRAALVMNLAPFADNSKGVEYRGIRTKQYSYIVTLDGPTGLYDTVKDQYQMDNLIDRPEYAKVQAKLDKTLQKMLKEIGDDFQDRDYYINEWGYVVNPKNYIIEFAPFNKGEGVVQSPAFRNK